MFSLYDTDLDGKINEAELVNTLQGLSYYVKITEVKELVIKLDKQKTGKVEYKDLFAFLQDKRQNRLRVYDEAQVHKDLLAAFETFDPKKTGAVSVSDFSKVITTTGEVYTPQELKDLLAIADPKNSGKIEYNPYIEKITTRLMRD